MIIIKTKEQIEGIRKSCQLSADTLRYITPFVKEGISTLELDQIAEKYIRDNGGIPAPLGYMGYPKATCISVNEVICHGIPGDYTLREGDIFNLDVSTILDGYYGDTGTMFAVGKITDEAKHLMNVAKKCLEIGINQVRPGNFFGNIGYAIYSYAMVNNCTVVYQYGGHGVGLEFHEEPMVDHIAKKNSGEKMRPGMIFTVEPMICQKAPDSVTLADGWTAVTADGGLSAQYEHSVLVTEKGFEILTV